MAFTLFGFEIRSKSDQQKDGLKSFVEPNEADGSISVTANVPGTGGTISTILDINGSARSEAELVNRYRSMMLQPEVHQAVDDIINEAINITPDELPVDVVTDDLMWSDEVKEKVRDEFKVIMTMLDFPNRGYEIFEKWYVDGRVYYHAVIDEKAPRKGIQELRYIDPRKIRKIKEYKQERVGEGPNTLEVKKVSNEYYMYTEHGFHNDKLKNRTSMYDAAGARAGIKIAADSIVSCNSGLLNERNTLVLSYLHSAYKPLNQLRMMEDASVIYRITRAPERRIFYVDVGNLPKGQSEQYLRDMMAKHKNRLVYDPSTGNVTDDRRIMSMTDDIWLPRREGGRGTEVDTLPGGQNLGEMEDIEYFQKKLFKALRIPLSRMEPDQGFALGRSSEISRDEVKFSKFVRRLRSRFAILFKECLRRQLILREICTPDEWDLAKDKIRFDFKKDNHFEELKETDLMQERLGILRDMDEYSGKYFSRKYICHRILRMNDAEIEDMKKVIAIEKAEDRESGGDEDDLY